MKATVELDFGEFDIPKEFMQTKDGKFSICYLCPFYESDEIGHQLCIASEDEHTCPLKDGKEITIKLTK